MSRRLSRTFLAMLALLLSASLPLLAQSQASTGQIAGTVKDSAGAIIRGATIKVVNTETGYQQTVASGEDGLYRAVLLPPGHYQITASQQGFAEATAVADVGVGRTPDVNFVMSVGARKEEVTVTAEALETTRHEEAAFVGATIVQNLPLNGRRFQDAILGTPTAAIDPQRGGLTLTGQKMVNTGSVNVDGLDYGQPFFGGIKGGERANFAPTLPLDAIQEFQIVRAGYTAEFGRSTGGTVQAATKSGTNAIHGSAQYVIRPSDAGKSNEYYDDVRKSLPASCTTCTVNPNPTLHQWGGSIGGPIKKDKLFFFGAYDQQRQRLPHQIFFSNLRTSGFAPTPGTQEGYDLYKGFEQPFTQTNDAYLFLIKTDYQISNKHRLSLRYNHSNYTGVNANSVGTSLSPTVNSALTNNGTELDSSRTVAGNLSSFFTNWANELRGQYSRETRPRIGNSRTPTVGLGIVGYFGSTSYLPTTEYDYRIQFADSMTRIKGTHTVKIGGEYNHMYAAQTFGFYQFGSFSYSVGSGATGVADTLAGVSNVVSAAGACGGTICNPSGHRFDNTKASYLRQVGNLAAAYAGDTIAFFAQDSWRVTPNFTVNYGLRWEGELNPNPPSKNVNSNVALVKGFVFPNGRSVDPTNVSNQLHQFEPRLGFAWSPGSDNKTVIRGFGGVYYAVTPLLLYSNTMGDYREPPANVSVYLPVAVPTSLAVPGGVNGTCPAPCNTVWKQLYYLAGINLDSSPLGGLPVISPDDVTKVTQLVSAASGTPFNKYAGANLITTANGFQNARSYQAGFGVEREISQGWTVGVEGVWIKTVHIQRDLDLNLNNPTSTDAAGRPNYNAYASRPIKSLNQIIVRDSTAKGLYRGVTLRTNLNRKWGQINAYYTLSENLTDDDNERDASGYRAMDPRNFAPDYSFSDQNRRHQFVAQPVFFLPWNIEVSNAFRFLSGAPFNVSAGNDYNSDKVYNDRPYYAVGVPFKRNNYTNKSLSFVDLRVQKGIKLSESKQIKLSAEMFNLFNSMNLQYASTQTNFCKSATVDCGIPGGAWTPNSLFMQLRDTSGNLLTTNSSVGSPFEAQFTFKFLF